MVHSKGVSCLWIARVMDTKSVGGGLLDMDGQGRLTGAAL